MLTAHESDELRAAVVTHSDRVKASGVAVGIVSHIGGPLAGLTIALAEPTPVGGFYGWVFATARGLVQVMHVPGARPGVWKFDHFTDQRGNTGKPVRVA